AARRFAAQNSSDSLQEPLLAKAAQGALESFSRQGFDGIIKAVPEAERPKVMEFAVPMIQMTLVELRNLVREQNGRQPLPDFDAQTPESQQWLQMALLGLANLPDYPAPVFMTMTNFDHIQASVFQITRSPGKTTVYLGSLFLVIGVFSMFYI